jgi:hypothetical protein
LPACRVVCSSVSRGERHEAQRFLAKLAMIVAFVALRSARCVKLKNGKLT